MVIAFIFINTKSGKEREVLELLRVKENIKEAHLVYGDFDIITKIETKDLEELNEFITNEIRNNEHIAMTSTLIGL